MSVDLNSVNLTGRLAADPKSPSDNITTFAIAVNGRTKNGPSQWIDVAHFIDIVTFGFTAQACAEHLTKGRMVALSGSLRQEHWTTKDGQKRTALKVVANVVKFIDGKRSTKADDAGAGQDSSMDPDEAFGMGGDFDDDLTY